MILKVAPDPLDAFSSLAHMVATLGIMLSIYLMIVTLGEAYLVVIHLFHGGKAIGGEQALFRSPRPTLQPEPRVCVQLAIYNEPNTVSPAIDSLCGLHWPKDRLEVMVLDDSTDATPAIIEERAAAWRAKGCDIAIVRRADRRDFKAGALQEGLTRTRADYIAIFDADYRPHADFLRDSMCVMASETRTGFVQARLDYRNRRVNWLTSAQAMELDTHFAYEQAARNWAG